MQHVGLWSACLRKPSSWGLFQADCPLTSYELLRAPNSLQTASSETPGGKDRLDTICHCPSAWSSRQSKSLWWWVPQFKEQKCQAAVCAVEQAIKRKKQEGDCQLLATWSHNCLSQPGHFSIQLTPRLASDISVENDIRESPTTCLTTNKFA